MDLYSLITAGLLPVAAVYSWGFILKNNIVTCTCFQFVSFLPPSSQKYNCKTQQILQTNMDKARVALGRNSEIRRLSTRLANDHTKFYKTQTAEVEVVNLE